MTAPRRSGARLIIDALLANGVDCLFTVPGESFLGLLDAALDVRNRLKVVTCRHEGGAAFMADAYAKATGRPAALAVTRGPGATNASIGVHTAFQDSTPLLAIVGQVPRAFRGREAFQEIALTEMFAPLATWCAEVERADDIPASFDDAFTAATGRAGTRPGPAVVSVPEDVFAETSAAADVAPAPPPRRAPDAAALADLSARLAAARRPLVVLGGGGWSAAACADMRRFLAAFDLPAAVSFRRQDRLDNASPSYVGTLSVGMDPALAGHVEAADLVVAVGTRLGDFATGSWSVFGNRPLTIIGVNAARFDAGKHLALPVVGDARESLGELAAGLDGWRCDDSWTARGPAAAARLWSYLDDIGTVTDPDAVPTYAQVIAAVNATSGPDDYALTSSGGFPGELNNGWRSRGVATFDCEYGFSCMGYEISGAWGAAMARRSGEVFAFVGDGSYLMLNSDLYSSVLHGHKMIVIVCDNGGFAVIERLQLAQGGASFNNMLADDAPRVDFAAHAAALGCHADRVTSIDALGDAVAAARRRDVTSVIVIETAPQRWTEGGAWWEVGVPEVSHRPEIAAARADLEAAKQQQRKGV